MVTLLKLQPIGQYFKKTNEIPETYSTRSMISKPLAHKMTILAFKKIKSKDSDGRKKSCHKLRLTSNLNVESKADIPCTPGTNLNVVTVGPGANRTFAGPPHVR